MEVIGERKTDRFSAGTQVSAGTLGLESYELAAISLFMNSSIGTDLRWKVKVCMAGQKARQDRKQGCEDVTAASQVPACAWQAMVIITHMELKSLRADNKRTSTHHAYVRCSRSKNLNVCKHTTHSAAHPAFKVALEKQEAWRERPGLEWDGDGGNRGCICISCTVGEWWICGGGVRPWHYVLQLVYKWTLKDMCRPLSTFQITATLQRTDEGRALGLPNPGSSLFHVLQLPTMLSWISRWRLSGNLKPVCNTKRIKPGWQ